MAYSLLSRLGRLGLAFVVAALLLAACLGLVSLAAQPANVVPDFWTRTTDPDLRGLRNLEGLLSAPAVDFVAGALAPVKATQGVPVTFTVNVVNTGELSVTLDTATALEFSDAAGGWFTATLAAATEVPTSTAPSYVQVALVFSPAAFPAGFAAGSYHPTLHLSGADADGQPYAATVTSSGNSVTVVDYVAPAEPIAVAAGSLDPADVIQTEPVSFRLALLNPNAMDITLGPGTTLAFTDSNGLVYTAALLGAPVLPTGVTTTVEFRLARVATETVPGVYTPAVALVGTDMGGQPVYQFTDLPDAVRVWENMPGLVEVPGSLQPTQPSRNSRVFYWVEITNTLPCTIYLSTESQIVLQDQQRQMHRAALRQPVTVPPANKTKLSFSDSDLSAVSNGFYQPYFRLLGTNECGNEEFGAGLVSQSQTEIGRSTGIGGGIAPATLVRSLTQFGGIFELQMYNAGGDEAQQLYWIELGRACADAVGCSDIRLMPPGTFQVDTEYKYLRPSEVGLLNLRITPSTEMTRGIRWDLINVDWFESHCASPICGKHGAGWNFTAYIADRDAKAQITGLSPRNTFVLRDHVDAIEMSAINPETGGATSVLGLVPLNTELRLQQGEADVSDRFVRQLTNSAEALAPQAQRVVTFELTPSVNAPAGHVQLDAQLSTRGVYPFYQRYRSGEETYPLVGTPYEGPTNVILTGTVTATDFISPAHIYVVDALPLTLAADSLAPTAVAWDASSVTLTARVSNTSDLSFTIFPTSELGIDFLPTQDVFLDIPIPAGTGPNNLQAFAQGFVVTQSVVLGVVDFTTYLRDGAVGDIVAELVAANESGGLPGTTLASVVMPAASSNVPTTTPPFDVILQPGVHYYLVFRGVNLALETYSGSDDIYPDGHAYVLSGDYGPDWVALTADVRLRLHRSGRYSGHSAAAVALPPHQSAVVTFTNAIPVEAKADGVYTPTLLLRGVFTDAVGTYNFHQHLDPAGNTVWVDGTPPAVSLDSLPAFISSTTFAVAWQGSDAFSGLAGFDVQVCEANGGSSLRGAVSAPKQSQTQAQGIASHTALAMTGQQAAACPAWTDWLTATAAPTATFAGADGATYTFRARAADHAGNLSGWTAAVTTTVDISSPAAEMGPLDAMSSGTFTVTWSGSDVTSGVAGYEVQVSKDGGYWQAAWGRSLSDIGPRTEHGWVYDSLRHRFILWGGGDGSQYHNDTWVFDGQGWRQIVTAHAPSIRTGFGMAYDSDRDRVVLFGGVWITGQPYYDETWEFDGVDWAQVSTAHSPTPRTTSLAYDAGRGRIVLFGGIAFNGVYSPLGDTWEYDGVDWIQKTPMHSPSGRAEGNPLLVYDSTRGRVILHAGWAPYCEVNDTWEYDGVEWSLRATNGPARFAHGMAYNSSNQRVILHGGDCGQWINDTWEYDPAAATWTLVSPTDNTTQQIGSLAYDPDNRRVLTYGGQYNDGLHAEMWAYDAATDAWETVIAQPDGIVSTGADGLSLTFVGADGHSYAFRARAADRAGNVSAWSLPVTTTMTDATPPVVAMRPITGFVDFPNFLVSWWGRDTVSGIAGFDVQARAEMTATWTDWLTNTTATSAIFTPADPRLAYQFRVRATDRAGHVSGWSAEVTGPNDATPPSVAMNALPAYANTTFTVGWSGSDAVAGLASFDVQACEGMSLRSAEFALKQSSTNVEEIASQTSLAMTIEQGIASQTSLAMTPQEMAACPQWADWLTATTALTATFSGADGYSYAFRARATDRAGNVSDWTMPVTTTVDTTAPVVALGALDAWSAGAFTVTWSGSDEPAGVASYELQVSKDGGAWQAVAGLQEGAPIPVGPRTGHGWVYDAARDRFVLWGGWNGSQYMTDTWEFDGLAWQQVNTAHAPAPRREFGMVYDSGRGRVVLFGGEATDGVLYDDTLEFDGTDWAQIATPHAPAPRLRFGMVYDTGRGRVVLFGGVAATGGLLGDTWEYNGADWIQRTTANAPAPRAIGQLLAYDSDRLRTILHGGWVGGCDSQTWEYDGVDWTLRNLAGPSRYYFEMAYDSYHRRVVLHGGSDCYAGVNDTWEYDPATAGWSLAVPTGGEVLFYGWLAYDPVSRWIVSYGGVNPNTGLLLDKLWAYDAGAHAWQQGGTLREGVLSTGADGLSLVFLGRDGHSYAFRARATDNAGNVSDWSAAVTTTVVASPPPAAAVAPSSGGAGGADLLLSWPRDATVTAFQLWRSPAPYFTPGAGGAALIGDQDSANCTVGTTTVTCTDAGALGSVGSYFYVVRVFNGVGLYSDSAGIGAIKFGVTPGGP